LAGGEDAFVTKLNPTGSALVYSTYLGGSGDQGASHIALDSAGEAYVAGVTSSTNFPTVNPLQATNNGGYYGYDAFVSELNATGSALVSSSYFGGNDDDYVSGIGVDSSGNIYVAGQTYSTHFSGIGAPGFQQTPTTAPCVHLPDGYIPFTMLYTTGHVLGGNVPGLLVGQMTIATFETMLSLPLPTFPNQGFCETPIAAPGYYVNLAIPTPAERAGNFSSFSTPIINPVTGQPFPGNIIPASIAPTVWAWPTNGISGGGNNDYVVKISLASAVSPSSTSLAFGPENVGAPSTPQTETITNTGTDILTISTATIGGTNADDFTTSADTCTGAMVAPNGACTINVTFTPSAEGSRSASLTFTDNASNSPQAVSLTGTGSAPVAGVSAPSLTFSNQNVGTTSASQPITLSNTGNAALTITSIATSANFAETDNCAGSVAASSSCTLNVTFTPTATGPLAGTLTITDNSNGVTGSTQTVTLTGTGTGPVVSLSSPLTFSAQLVGTTSSSQTVTLTNTGGSNLTFAAIAATPPFAIASSGTTCSTSAPVAAAATCTVAVTFTPTAGGTASGGLAFSDNAPSSPQTLALSGTGQDFTMAAASNSSTSATTAPGSPATYTLSVGGEGGLTGTVTFTCIGAPTGASCGVSPNPVTAGSTATNVTVTVITAATSVSTPRSRPLPPVPPLWPGLRGLLMLALVLAAMAWAIMRRNQPGVSRWRFAMLPLAAGLLLTLALAGCHSSGPPTAATYPGTPSGTYTLTVTGRTGSGSSALSHTVYLTLIVS
jgi:hypothetical protein